MTRTILAHARRWKRLGGSHVIMWRGQPCGTIKATFDAACRRAGLEGVSPHTLKHTAVTWAFQKGMTREDAADFFVTSAATLERVYRQHSPHYQKGQSPRWTPIWRRISWRDPDTGGVSG